MQTLAEMLMNQPKPYQPEEQQKSESKSIAYILSKKSMELNADKPCSKCGHPHRHKSPTGRTNTTLCTRCYKAKNAKLRKSAL